MRPAERNNGLVSAKSFIRLIGAEYHLLERSGSSSLLKFYISAITIVIIMVLSLCSIFYAMELLFHMMHVEILLATFLSLLFGFIYIFLLNTFSKQVLKDKSANNTRAGRMRISLSDIVRTGFVILMAFLLAKPIEVYVFRAKLDRQVEVYKTSLLNEYRNRIQALEKPGIEKLEAKLQYYTRQLANYRSAQLQTAAEGLQRELAVIKRQQEEELHLAADRINRSDFFLYRVKKVTGYQSWLLTIGVIFLFLLPGYLIYSIGNDDRYYQLKKEWEENIVRTEYSNFEKAYSTIFKERYGLDLQYYSKFKDPPLNKLPEKKGDYRPETDFFKKFGNSD